MVMTLSEAKERILVELWLQPRLALTVAELQACLNVELPTVERAVAELVAEGQLFDQGHGYGWSLARHTAVMG